MALSSRGFQFSDSIKILLLEASFQGAGRGERTSTRLVSEPTAFELSYSTEWIHEINKI
jgi:hypothetical protein